MYVLSHACLSEGSSLIVLLVINMPPAFINGFTSTSSSQSSFGSDMGSIVVPASNNSISATSTTHGPNVTIAVGRKLVRGTWNAQPYVLILHQTYPLSYVILYHRWGALFEEQVSGVAKGTDFYFNKSRWMSTHFCLLFLMAISNRPPLRDVGDRNPHANLASG